MTDVYTRQQCRQVDCLAIERYGLPGVILMENAGRGVVEKMLELGCAGPVLVCCGKGNNGGDGFVIARHLDLRGISVRMLLWADPDELAGDAAINCRIVQRAGLPLTVCGPRAEHDRLAAELTNAAWVVDALLGTGATGEPRPPYAQVIGQLNASGRPIVAVDLPSGLDCDSGIAAAHTIRARHTCTFVGYKPGFLVPGAAEYTGQVYVIDIGVPRRLLAEISGSVGEVPVED
ncbi:MAG: NAD(P)H-hydrate epimerase [Pirellulales bacterium]